MIYTAAQGISLILCFSFYAFLGWLLESSFKTIRERHFVNSGFLLGPFVPLYGFGALFIIDMVGRTDLYISASSPITALLTKMALAIVLTTTLEYLTGWLLETLFHCKWWDYSDEAFNLQGRICLKYSILWGLISFWALNLIQPFYTGLVSLARPDTQALLASLLLAYFTVDCLRSAKEALGLKHLMAGYHILEAEKQLAQHLESRLHSYNRLFLAFPHLAAYDRGELRKFRDLISGHTARRALKDRYSLCIEDVINNPSVQMMRSYPHHFRVSCFEHSVHVSYVSFILCKLLGMDYYSAARGGLLHDLFLYDWHSEERAEALHGFSHPKIAYSNADSMFQLNNIEKDIILKHMFPLTWPPPRYREAWVVCWADKFCTISEFFSSRFRPTAPSGLIAKLGYSVESLDES